MKLSQPSKKATIFPHFLEFVELRRSSFRSAAKLLPFPVPEVRCFLPRSSNSCCHWQTGSSLLQQCISWALQLICNAVRVVCVNAPTAPDPPDDDPETETRKTNFTEGQKKIKTRKETCVHHMRNIRPLMSHEETTAWPGNWQFLRRQPKWDQLSPWSWSAPMEGVVRRKTTTCPAVPNRLRGNAQQGRHQECR